MLALLEESFVCIQVSVVIALVQLRNLDVRHVLPRAFFQEDRSIYLVAMVGPFVHPPLRVICPSRLSLCHSRPKKALRSNSRGAIVHIDGCSVRVQRHGRQLAFHLL